LALFAKDKKEKAEPEQKQIRREIMRKEEASLASRELNALLGRGSQFEGKLVFEGTVRIDGKFKGEIHSKGKLIIGENGEVEGDVWVDSAIISGKLKGNIKAEKKVELLAPAKLTGNISTKALVIQEGAVFDGNCQMSEVKEKSTTQTEIKRE